MNDVFNNPSYLISGDIGGHMGLFIGASILTILELFDYLYEVRHKALTLFKFKHKKDFELIEDKVHHH